MTTGQRMKNRRIELGITVQDIAKSLNISVATVYRYEKGDIEKVPGKILEPLAKILQTTPAYLMGWESSTTSSPKKVDSSEELVNIYEQLIPNNQKKVLTYSKSLLSAQQMEEELLEPNAAHGMNPTGEEIKHADDVMKNDSEWI